MGYKFRLNVVMQVWKHRNHFQGQETTRKTYESQEVLTSLVPVEEELTMGIREP